MRREERLKSWGFRERVIAVAILPATLMAAVLAAYFLLLRYADAEEAFIHRGQSLLRLFTPATEYGVFSGNVEELRRLAAALASETDFGGVVIQDYSGLPLTQIGTLRLTQAPQILADGWHGPTPDGLRHAFHAKIWRTRLAFDDALAASEDPAMQDAIGSVTLEMSRSGMQRLKREMMLVTLLVTLVTLLLGILLALRLSSSVTLPVLSLQRVVGAIRGGDLSARVSPHPAGTLRNLEEGINEMAAALQAGRDQLESRIAAATAELKQKRDEAEQASIAKSRFLAAASHDLRQPLHALSLFAAELAGESRLPAQQRLARQISVTVGTMEELLGSLLDVSRADLGAIRPCIQPVALDGLLERVHSAHAGEAGQKGLRLRLHPTCYWGLSDPALLYRMVSNLVANAIAYCRQGGVLIGVRPAGGRLRIEVWDTGVGIPHEQQALVFEEFYQVSNPERDPGKGLGLGLSLVDRLSRLLDHPVGMRSAPGRGSMFSITLPRATGPERAGKAGPDIHKVRLLMLGENSADNAALCELLSGWGCDVIRCVPPLPVPLPTEQVALVICEDAVFTEALPLISPQAAVRGLPVLLLGTLPPGSGKASYGFGLSTLAKPPRPAKLRALLTHLLDDTGAPDHGQAGRSTLDRTTLRSEDES